MENFFKKLMERLVFLIRVVSLASSTPTLSVNKRALSLFHGDKSKIAQCYSMNTVEKNMFKRLNINSSSFSSYHRQRG